MSVSRRKRSKFGGEELEPSPSGRPVDRPAAASSAAFPPRRAEIDDPHAGPRAKQPRCRVVAGCYIHHSTVAVAFELGDRRVCIEVHGAGRRDDFAKPLGPPGGVAFDAEGPASAPLGSRGDGARDAVAVGRAPALGEPGGRNRRSADRNWR